MNFFSLNQNAPKVSFREAAIKGQAPDGGLYFPETIPTLSADFLNQLTDLEAEEIGYTVMHSYVGEDIGEADLRKIIQETISFPFPLIEINENIHALELFHGPTMAFKDVGARFMSRCLGHFREKNNPITVLVATSGDTGGAVANGFYEVDGIEVVILFPSKKVSPVQELQLTRLGKNIKAVEIEGNFDDCQRIVKTAFLDKELTQMKGLTSANSINVARWLPQQIYYFLAIKEWQKKYGKQLPAVVCVPSGNFGNICAGLLAKSSGLPIRHFLAACNKNAVVPEYLETGIYEPQKAIPTLSNAMDVGDPSNFVRIQELFKHNLDIIKAEMNSSSTDDLKTLRTIRDVWNQDHYMLDPHGAVAYHALSEYQKSHPEQKGFILETAAPIKFQETIYDATGVNLPLTGSLKALSAKEKHAVLLQADYAVFKKWLLS